MLVVVAICSVLQPLREKCAGETDAAKKTFLQATLVSSGVIE